MEIKKGKVVAVVGNGTWEGQYGLMYKFEVEMDNGDNGQYLSKGQDCAKFPKGADVFYTIDAEQRNGNTYYKIKPAQDPSQPQTNARGGGGYQKDPETEKRISRMSVLKVAGDLVINGAIKLHDITKVAQIFERYIMTGEDSMAQVYAQAQPKKPQATSGIMDNFKEEEIKDIESVWDNDLPF